MLQIIFTLSALDSRFSCLFTDPTRKERAAGMAIKGGKRGGESERKADSGERDPNTNVSSIGEKS